MLLEIDLYSSETGHPILAINQQGRWLNHLFFEGLVDCDKISYQRILINVFHNREFNESKIQNDIFIYKIFDLDAYLGIDSKSIKCKYLLDFLLKSLCEYDFGVPPSFWQAGYEHCIKNNFLYKFTQRRKPLVYKSLKKSFALYVELDIYELKLFVEISPLDGTEKERVLVALLLPSHINNFRFHILSKNKDHTFNIEDKAYYSTGLFINNIDLKNPEVYKSDKITFPRRPR